MAVQLRFYAAAPVPQLHFSSLPSRLHQAAIRLTPFRDVAPLRHLRRDAPSPDRRGLRPVYASSSVPPLDLTEENILRVLDDARSELGQIFDASVGITGTVDLAELDGPFVKLRLKGRFWHKRSTVLERMGQYLKNRIPEVLEVEIEDEKQLDDSPENF